MGEIFHRRGWFLLLSVIVDPVDVPNVASVETKDDTPVVGNANRPVPGQIALRGNRGSAETTHRSREGSDDVIPLGDVPVGGDVDRSHPLVHDLDAGEVFLPVEPSVIDVKRFRGRSRGR